MSKSFSGPARLIDVAEAAGVHVSTASRVLNGVQFAIKQDTRRRIVRAAAALNYQPNANGRGLKLATTGAIGLLIPSLRNPVYSAIIRGAFDRAWARKYVVLLAEDSGTQGTAASGYERLIGEGRIDGLMIASARPESRVTEKFARQSFPTVFVNRRQSGSKWNVSMREEDAGRLAAEHLIALGHERLGHVAGPENLDTAQRRVDGFVGAAKVAGRTPTVVHAPFDEAGGFAAMSELLSSPAPPTGVFASSITQAIGAMAAARVNATPVPSKVSLVGYDDDPVGAYLEAPLTAIAMPLLELGSVAVDALIDQIEGAAPHDIEVATPPALVIRGSTAPPPDTL